jgi:hypothetical protein
LLCRFDFCFEIWDLRNAFPWILRHLGGEIWTCLFM